MSKVSKVGYENDQQKCFLEVFEKLSYGHSPWEVWSDFIFMTAISISSCICNEFREGRERTYQTIVKKYTDEEQKLFASLLANLIEGLESNPNQDFLGALYMRLKLGNGNAGQFFTPYHICELMSEMTANGVEEQVAEQGWISVNDPTCGAGGLLIAYANTCLKHHVNYQTSVLFVGQDIDPVVGLMCYIQLCLLGCPGYVIIDDSLQNPPQSLDGSALLPVMSDNLWLTPMYFRDVWLIRRMLARLKLDGHVPAEDSLEVSEE